MEILPYIDKSIIKNNSPKWITGYSDSSLLGYFITTNFNNCNCTTTCNIITFWHERITSISFKSNYYFKNCSESTQNSFELFEKREIPKN